MENNIKSRPKNCKPFKTSLLRSPLPFQLFSKPPQPSRPPQSPPMPRVDIVKPAWLRDRGYYLWTCREYVEDVHDIVYDYRLVKSGYGEVTCSPAGRRGMLAYSFPAHFYPGRARYPIPLHRLMAFNDPTINPGHQRNYRADIVVHHEPHPRWRPWKNSRRSNMKLMTQAEHEEWHRRPENADVGR